MGNHLPKRVVLEDGGTHEAERKCVWLREIENGLKRFGASIEWLIERISLRDEEIAVLRNGEMEAREKDQIVRAKMMKSIDEVLEEVVVLIDTHLFNEFSETKSSQLLKKVQSVPKC